MGPTNIDSKAADEMESERLQTFEERNMFNDEATCILCAFSVVACPVKLKQDPNLVESAEVLRAHRYIFDSRIADTKECMRIWEKSHRI